jgi:hypothetical protein
MKIMAFVGSPRKGSNVDTLIDKVSQAQIKIPRQIRKRYIYMRPILKTVLDAWSVRHLRAAKRAR